MIENPMRRKDIYATEGIFGVWLESEYLPDGDYVSCEDVVDRINRLISKGVMPEEVLAKVIEELSQ